MTRERFGQLHDAVELVAEAICKERERLMGWKVNAPTETDRAYAKVAVRTIEKLR